MFGFLSERVGNHDDGSRREPFAQLRETARAAAGQTDAPSPARLRHLDPAEQKRRFLPLT